MLPSVVRGAAQRRPALPGRQPTQHTQICSDLSSSLNEGRPFRAGNPSRRAPRGCPSTTSLNEGRPFRAGNPPPSAPSATAGSQHAQRRPALPGRQPRALIAAAAGLCRRSTKAGPSGPATRRRRSRSRCETSSLNEGRPFRAGNPPPGAWGIPTGRTRSTKAGPSGPATPECPVWGLRRRLRAQRRPALPGRQPQVEGAVSLRAPIAQRRPALPGRQPGVAVPVASVSVIAAQRRPALPGRQPRRGHARPIAPRRSLNEGRPFRAGNPRRTGRRSELPLLRRSTKAGPSGPATPEGTGPGAPATDPRSTKAGPSGPATPHCWGLLLTGLPVAQRRPALPGRQPLFSCEWMRRRTGALNEGRPFRAGNPQ